LYYYPYKVLAPKVEDYLNVQNEITTVANSEYTKLKLKKIGIKNISVIYPPICESVYYEGLKQERQDQVITISRVTGGKGLDEFVEVARNLPEIKFILICFVLPAEYAKLRALSKRGPENLSIRYNMSSSDRLNLIWSSKVFLSFARNEHFGSAVLESIVAGCTPIVYPEGGVLEIVNGIEHFEAKNCDEAKEQIKYALDTWDTQNARNRSLKLSEKFGFGRFTKEFIPVIEERLREKAERMELQKIRGM